MMDNQKLEYFTPDIEDIRVGYECEIWWNWNYLPENEWCAVKALNDKNTEDFDLYDFTSRISKNEIRVPYLTKEQIEAEGWKLLGNYNNSEPSYSKGEYSFVQWRMAYPKDKKVYFFHFGELIYNGQCKDINTFRYISKLLGI